MFNKFVSLFDKAGYIMWGEYSVVDYDFEYDESGNENQITIHYYLEETLQKFSLTRKDLETAEIVKPNVIKIYSKLLFPHVFSFFEKVPLEIED